MTDINDVVLESLGEHFKKHWKKYALGLGSAAALGAGAYNEKKKYDKLKSNARGHAAAFGNALIDAGHAAGSASLLKASKADIGKAALLHGAIGLAKGQLARVGVNALIKDPHNRNKAYSALLGLKAIHSGVRFADEL